MFFFFPRSSIKQRWCLYFDGRFLEFCFVSDLLWHRSSSPLPCQLPHLWVSIDSWQRGLDENVIMCQLPSTHQNAMTHMQLEGASLTIANVFFSRISEQDNFSYTCAKNACKITRLLCHSFAYIFQRRLSTQQAFISQDTRLFYCNSVILKTRHLWLEILFTMCILANLCVIY